MDKSAVSEFINNADLDKTLDTTKWNTTQQSRKEHSKMIKLQAFDSSYLRFSCFITNATWILNNLNL